MTATTPPELLRLVDRFDDQREAYRSGRYNETQARREFIDPFFKLLGWDIDNSNGAPEAYKDVIHEDAIKIGGAHKAPDYGFRVGGVRQFFVEAKAPSVNLDSHKNSAFQLRRYAWSAKLSVSILTDFEELAVYDCRFKPDKDDRPTTARIQFHRYEDYPDTWVDLVALFSKEAVQQGALDAFAQATSTKRGTETVDAVFLKEIESWRELLARDIASRNPELTQRQLSFAVQMTIDRIVFLRMTEDRGIEDYGRLQALVNGGETYERLRELYRQADERYNSGLFHFRQEKDRSEKPDTLTPILKIGDKPLKTIFKNLYFPDSPYEFSVLPVEVLGQVYEQFLGKVIDLSPNRKVVIGEKPEVRKAGGVYYTPKYIVDYIVGKTVGALLVGKKPGPKGSASKITIVDPACGSGSFLIGAYQYLLDWHRDKYLEAGPDKHRKELYQGAGGQWLLTTSEKKRILLNNIYGVDIDPQAVEVTKLSLLLKVLEGESSESLVRQLSMFRERALPDLGNNIKCGNSLIGPDFYDGHQLSMLSDEEHYRVNVFDWNAAFPSVFRTNVLGFDVVIGNPPYDVMEKQRLAASWPHIALAEYARNKVEYADALGGKLNLFRFFLVRSLELLKGAGMFGMIVPMAILADISCARTRRTFMVATQQLEADCFPQKDNPNRRIFIGAKLSTTILTCKKRSSEQPPQPKIQIRIYPGNSFAEPHRESTVSLADTLMLDPVNTPIPLADADAWDLCRRIHSARRVLRLGDFPEFVVTRGEINQTVYRRYITDDPTQMRMLKGVEIGPYRLNRVLSQGRQEWINEKEFLRVNSPKPIVNERRIATQRITGVDERLRIVATIIEPVTYFADSTNSIVLRGSLPYEHEYLLGLLNSRLFQWRFKITSSNNNVGTNELLSLPFRIINFDDPADHFRHNQMVSLAQRMLALYNKLENSKIAHERSNVNTQITATDEQINRLVYDLYDLTEVEIAMVEG